MPAAASASPPYPASDLSDPEWAILAPLLPPAKPGGRPRSVDLRMILDGVFHVLRSGCQWRLLPREYGPWSTVYGYFRAWRLDGTWERVHTTLRARLRRQLGREPTPSAAILDSQSVETTERGGPHGFDGAKKLSGRKRHLPVDTLGLVLRVLVHRADFQDRAGAPVLLLAVADSLPRLEPIWADSAYVGSLQTWVWATFAWRLEIVAHPGGRGQWLPAGQEPPPRLPGFHPLPHRWIVERTIAWIGRNRRMSKDYGILARHRRGLGPPQHGARDAQAPRPRAGPARLPLSPGRLSPDGEPSRTAFRIIGVGTMRIPAQGTDEAVCTWHVTRQALPHCHPARLHGP